MPAAIGLSRGFRGLKTVGWKWHKTRRLDPTRVGRHWLALAIATWLAVAYGTRREEAEARHREPGALGAAPCAGRTPATPEPARALGAGRSSHSSLALSPPRPPRSSASRGRQTGNSAPLPQPRPRTTADSRSPRAWPGLTRAKAYRSRCFHPFPAPKIPLSRIGPGPCCPCVRARWNGVLMTTCAVAPLRCSRPWTPGAAR